MILFYFFKINFWNIWINVLMENLFKVSQVHLEPIWKFIENFCFCPLNCKKAHWVLNTYTPEVDNKDTRTTSFMLFLCFYCWLWTNLVHRFSCIFDIFHKLMFPLFWPNNRNDSRINKILYSVKLEP